MDRSLATLLRSLQTSNSYEDASRLLPTATGFLTQLTNPLNLSLLASQLLASSHLFPPTADLPLCRKIFGIFYTASLRLVEDQTSVQSEGLHRLSVNAWSKAVIKGADDQSPRWRHVLLIGGVLLGLDGQKLRTLSSTLRAKLESALVTASNLALEQKEDTSPISDHCVLRYDLFLPVAIEATLFSREGLEHGYWLGLIDADVQDIKSKVLISSLGPLSRLIAHSIDNVNTSLLILDVVARISDFARILDMSWKQNKLSEIEVPEEANFLDAETLKSTTPVLWQTLREVLFAVVVLLRATLGRLLCDPVLSTDANAPLIAMQTLHTLRHLNFIAARLGQTSTSQYVFVNFTAIDILNQFPDHAEKFLRAIRPVDLGRIPIHPLEISHDLFFFDSAEHFTLTINPAVSEELLLAATMPYVSDTGHGRSIDVYEAAHSVLLALFAAPQNFDLASRHLPFYVETLMQSFPKDLSARQLRLAVKSILRVVAPPSPIFNALPLMPSIILDLIHTRAMTASAVLLPTSKDDHLSTATTGTMSEQSALILALIDSLPFLSTADLEEWLPLTANLINKATNILQKSSCQQRFWEVLSSGEMDVERSAICVAWWTTKGGREMLLFDDQYANEEDDYMMTGVLHTESKL